MSIPSPTQLRNVIEPILRRGEPTTNDIRTIIDATGNPNATVSVEYDHNLATNWRYKRLRDAEKILSVTIYLKQHKPAQPTTAQQAMQASFW